MKFECVVIFGSNGKFGRVFSERLESVAGRIYRIDLAGTAGTTAGFIDPLSDPAAVQEAVCSADLITLATPEGPAADIVATLLPYAQPTCVAFDILSVKQDITRTAEAANLRCNYVSAHPMFAPRTDFAGQNVILTEVSGHHGADMLEMLFQSWGANTSRMTAEAHDNATALTQVACHAALLCFGLVCSRSGMATDTLRKVETPVSRILLAMSARIASGDPHLYQLIQDANAEGPAVRALLAETMATINTGGQLGGEFTNVFDSVNSWLGEDAHKYVELAARLVGEDDGPATRLNQADERQ